jgi:hypothetical protein
MRVILLAIILLDKASFETRYRDEDALVSLDLQHKQFSISLLDHRRNTVEFHD